MSHTVVGINNDVNERKTLHIHKKLEIQFTSEWLILLLLFLKAGDRRARVNQVRRQTWKLLDFSLQSFPSILGELGLLYCISITSFFDILECSQLNCLHLIFRGYLHFYQFFSDLKMDVKISFGRPKTYICSWMKCTIFTDYLK